ncbi:MAG: O-antigen ligase family protein [Candidatus Omnitrophica bacterium]|nr:O-antigen ligase family protein [Candidatus Omnitrophota bacterium]MDD5430158.1 O-antigen ligase family protein [Candidatus Omnitrophota bacterium]
MKKIIHTTIFLIIGVLIIYLISKDSESRASWIVSGLLTVVLLAILPVKYFLYFFIGSLFFDRYIWEFLNFSIRPSQIMGILLFLKWLFAVKHKRSIFSNILFIPLVLFIVASLISSIFNSGDLSRNLQLVLLSVVFFCPIFPVVSLLGNQKNYEKILKFYILLGAAMAVYGLIAYILFVMFNINIGVINSELGGRIVGTQHNAGDHFGLQMMFFVIIMFNYLHVRSIFISTRKIKLLLFIFIPAMMLSFKRIAFIGVIISFLSSWLVLCSQHKMMVFAKKFLGLITVGSILVILFNLLTVKENVIIDREIVTRRYSKDINVQTHSMQSRLNNWEIGLEIYKEHPLIGNGPGTAEGGFWVSNVLIRTMADTGILGLLAVIFLLVRIFMLGFRAVRFSNKVNAAAINVHVVGMLSAFISLVFVNMVDDQFLLGMFWFHISLIVATFNLAIKLGTQTERQIV